MRMKEEEKKKKRKIFAGILISLLIALLLCFMFCQSHPQPKPVSTPPPKNVSVAPPKNISIQKSNITFAFFPPNENNSFSILIQNKTYSKIINKSGENITLLSGNYMVSYVVKNSSVFNHYYFDDWSHTIYSGSLFNYLNSTNSHSKTIDFHVSGNILIDLVIKSKFGIYFNATSVTTGISLNNLINSQPIGVCGSPNTKFCLNGVPTNLPANIYVLPNQSVSFAFPRYINLSTTNNISVTFNDYSTEADEYQIVCGNDSIVYSYGNASSYIINNYNHSNLGGSCWFPAEYSGQAYKILQYLKRWE